MNLFNEANTVEALIRDTLCGKPPSASRVVAEVRESYAADDGVGWRYVPPGELLRQPQEVFVESLVRQALVRLKPAIAEVPQQADEVLYRLREMVLAVRGEGLIRANERFMGWLRNELSMPFGPNHEHVTVRLIDYDELAKNEFVVTTQYVFRAGAEERRADLVLLVNGFPLVLVEAKTPVREAVSWVDGALQVHDEYERVVPELFACNVFSVASEGKTLRYGAIRMPVELWGPWQIEEAPLVSRLTAVQRAVQSLLRPHVLLDILAHFTLFATDKQKRRLKLVCRYQQYDAANKIVQRVRAGWPRKGLIWHFQGSGKSLLMVFAAQKLRLEPLLRNPTILIVVDRVDLNAQISATFHASDIPNLVKADSRDKLERLLKQGTRKIIITTIFMFGEAEGVLNERKNIIVLVDEAHRTQEGDLGSKMRAALPNAFLFGLTGTPINRRERNTFYAFGAEEDQNGYLSRYGFEESIRDGATLPLHFEPRLLELHLHKEAIDEAYAQLTDGLSDQEKEKLARMASKMAVLIKHPARIAKICADIASHMQEKVLPNGFKGMVVTIDQESCLLYKEALDQYLPPHASEVVISVAGKERKDSRYKRYKRHRDAEEKLLDRFRDGDNPLQLLIVTHKLLTGFDAPILQAMYLDRPLRDHTLLQAICRTNRTYGDKKTHGLIVDYLGVFDEVASALQFDEEGIQHVISNIASLKEDLPAAMQRCLAYFAGVDRTLTGYDGLIAAQACLPNNNVRDAFAADYSRLAKLWETLSPDPILEPYTSDYRWLSQLYLSVQPTTGTGKLIWHSLGAKTIALIQENLTLDTIHDDLERIALDAHLLEAILGTPTPNRQAKEIEIKVRQRLREHNGNTRYHELSTRLEQLKERHEHGQLHSVEFLKHLLDLARDLVHIEQDIPAPTKEERGKAALTTLFEDTHSPTPIIVEPIVNDIDHIVRKIRFPNWQQSSAGEREVRKSLRKTLLKYDLHKNKTLFEQAYGYIKQYY